MLSVSNPVIIADFWSFGQSGLHYPRSMCILSKRSCIGILVLLGILLYGHAIVVNDFVSFDDSSLITRNPAVQAFTLRAVWHFFTSYDPELYVPLTMLSLQLTHAVVGLAPWAFHAGNLALHIACTILLFFSLEELTGERTLSFVVAAVFAVHPLNAEAVLWAAARKDVLSAAFCLGALWTYLRYKQTTEPKMLILSIALFFLGLLSKVSIVTLPVLFLVLEFTSGERTGKTVKRLSPYFLLSIIFGLVAIYGKRGILESSSTWETIVLTVRSTGFYLWKTIAAWDFAVIYPVARPITVDVVTIISCIGVLSLVTAVWLFRKKMPLAAFGLLWFFLFLLPNSTNYLKNGFLFAASDRYAYLALPGILLVIVELAKWTMDRRQWTKNLLSVVRFPLSVFVIVLLSASTLVQAQTWRNSESLYRNVLRRTPHSTLALTNLGVEIAQDAARAAEGEQLLRRALEIDPNMVQALVKIGQLEKKRGNIALALEYFARAANVLDARSQRFFGLDDLGAYYYLAELHEDLNKPDLALVTFERAVKRAPQLAEPHHNYGAYLQKRGRTEEAIHQFLLATELEPTYIPSHYLVAGLLSERGHLEEAVEHLRAVVAINPGYEKAALHLQNLERMLAQ